MEDKRLAALDWTMGELNSLVKNLGETTARQIQRGEVEVTLVEKARKKLFDKHGRRIPAGLKAKVFDANRKCQLNQPKLNEEVDFANRILRLHGCLGIDTKVTASQLMTETERLLAIIKGNPQIANITNGVYLPVILPKLVTDDLGTELELYLAGVKKSYTKTFGDRTFEDECKGTLAAQVDIVKGSRHEELITRMKQRPIIGLHFPNSLQGFSVHANREQMSTLPQGFILSGVDNPIAVMMYPDILVCDLHVPTMNLSALQWRNAGCSFGYRVYDDQTVFDSITFLALSGPACSGGLLFLG